MKYRKWSSVLKEEFHGRVHKISLDLGAGCPHRDDLRTGGCIFCDFRGGGSGAAVQGISLEEQIRQGALRAQKRFKAKKGILYFQSYSATNLPLAELRKAVQQAREIASEYLPVVGVALGTRPDLVPEPFLDFTEELIREDLAIWLELGIQTTQEEGLLFLNRGHTLEAAEDALARAVRRPGLRLCAHLIAGIPGEPEDQLLRSAEWLCARGVRSFKFHPLHVLKNTPLEKRYLEKSFHPLSLEEYAERVAEVLRHHPDIIVQRLTADAGAEFLVAPPWIRRKQKVIQAIENRLEQ